MQTDSKSNDLESEVQEDGGDARGNFEKPEEAER